jgi:hypothetical protein|tara:strand:- start:1358 stop:1525 length:168 start_codon:yes stop_codon:yes gene_type:complete
MKMYAKGAEVRKTDGDSAEIKNKDKADLDNDGSLSSYEVARAKKIEESMAKRRTA